MSYIGRGVDAISNVEKLDNITFNGGTTYALTKSSAAFTPVGANNILISIDGVIQQGNFSVSTTNIVFDWSPTSSNTCNFILHYGTGVLNVPADGSIVAAKMAANSVDSDSYVDGSIDAVHLSANSVDSDAYVDGSIDAVHLSANSVDSDAYVDGSIDTAHIGALQVTGAKLNTDVISAQTALAVAPADTDEFMVSDAGVLKRIDYSLIKASNTPAFQAKLSASQSPSGSTWTTIAFNTELYDTDGCYDNSTNYRFTPTTAGKYFVYWSVVGDISAVPSLKNISTRVRKNGSGFWVNFMSNNDNNWVNITSGDCTVVDMNGSSDYLDVQGYIIVSSGANYFIADSYFGAYLLIGA